MALEVLQSAEILLLGHSPRHGVCLLSLLLVPDQASAEDTGGWRVLVEAAEVEDGEAVGGRLCPLQGEMGGQGLGERGGAQLADLTSPTHSPAQT